MPADGTVVVTPSVLNQINLVGIELLTNVLTGASALLVDERRGGVPPLSGPGLLAAPGNILLDVGEFPLVSVECDCVSHLSCRTLRSCAFGNVRKARDLECRMQRFVGACFVPGTVFAVAVGFQAGLCFLGGVGHPACMR